MPSPFATTAARPACGSRAGHPFAAAVLIVGLSGWAAADTAPGFEPEPLSLESLSLDDALRAAQARSRALAAQDDAAAAAGELAVAAGQLPDPVLRVALDNLPVDGADRYSLTDDFMTMRSLGVMQTMTSAAKRHARAQRFTREAEAAQTARILALTRLRQETALAWVDRYYQEHAQALLQRLRAEVALQIDAAEAAYRGGRGPQTEAIAARAAVAEIDDRIRAAETRRADAIAGLARWVGARRASAPLGPAPDISRVRLADAGLEQAADHHPDLALLAKREAVARAEADVARQEKHPDWSLELMYSQRGPGFSNMVSVAVSVPLPWDQGNRQDRELAARLALAAQMRDERVEMTREHRAEITRWRQGWRADHERLAAYDRTLVPLAGERTRAALAAYRGASGSLAAVLDARRMEVDTALERLQIEQEAAEFWARLEYLLPAEHLADAAASPDPDDTWERPR